eukprot:CAMPEP_0119553894 /NCGR_PEP_ID=MMETSP1352-20130426/6520_1 /TAXON_ID=265584 /ORGANISM="Stauroneis constricta, Strain CCMP1120" /LENGTH=590 /DNA_ID=CAMNT_0007600377 /DNA_START=239 /DNA_END=2008 /DNA_ORIENTATION=+
MKAQAASNSPLKSQTASTPNNHGSTPPGMAGPPANANQRRQHNNNNKPSTARGRHDKKRNQSKSRSPMRNQQSKSRSPMRRNNSNDSYDGNHGRRHQGRSPTRHNNNNNNHRHRHPAKMTVITNRVDLWDSAAHYFPAETNPDLMPHHNPNLKIAPFHYVNRGPLRAKSDCDPSDQLEVQHNDAPSPTNATKEGDGKDHQTMQKHGGLIAIAHVPHVIRYDHEFMSKLQNKASTCDVIDTSIPNPHDPSVVHNKYWSQRRRLFSRFDAGVQLDAQGWYSVTPEIIADHVALRVAQLASTCPGGITLLDAFCGCGGNSIAFGKVPAHLIKQVVCLDTDRTKLMKAAHNASIYGIPREKLVFVECNAIFVMRHVYKDGTFVLDQPHAAMPPYMPPPVMPSVHSGYHIGGLDMLPRHIDAVFMDPPWGGVDYESLGKNGYDLEKNMRIKVSPDRPPTMTLPAEQPPAAEAVDSSQLPSGNEGGLDDFFDDFATKTTKSSSNGSTKQSQQERRARFNSQNSNDDGEFINGADLIQIAAEATRSRVVIYDMPRNTNKTSLGKSALKAGYHGNIKLEEHYLNGRLKTVTAYMGADF